MAQSRCSVSHCAVSLCKDLLLNKLVLHIWDVAAGIVAWTSGPFWTCRGPGPRSLKVPLFTADSDVLPTYEQLGSRNAFWRW